MHDGDFLPIVFICSLYLGAAFLRRFWIAVARLTFVFAHKEATMMDLLYVAILVGFFVLSAAVVYGCELLRRPS